MIVRVRLIEIYPPPSAEISDQAGSSFAAAVHYAGKVTQDRVWHQC